MNATAQSPEPLTALITGASSGIGEALARALAREGHRLERMARGGAGLNLLAEALHAERTTRIDLLRKAATHNTRLADLPGFPIGDVESVAAAGFRACLDAEEISVPGVIKLAATLAPGENPPDGRYAVLTACSAAG